MGLNVALLRECRGCNKDFQPESNRQLTCLVCAPDKESRHRFNRYKITKPDYDKLKKESDGICPLCEMPMFGNECIDHDHKTGKVIGLICRGCNMVVSRFEDKEYAHRVAVYLEKGGNHCVSEEAENISRL